MRTILPGFIAGIALLLAACGGGGESGGSGGTPPGPAANPRSPTVPVITLSATSVIPGTEVTVSATSTDPEGGALSYAWDFGDGTVASGANATHVFTAEGNFSIRVTVTDPQGLTSTSVQAVAVAWLPMAPPAYFVHNPQQFLGEVLFARVDLPEIDGVTYTFDWELGDGSTVTGADVKYRYAATGTYTVRLTITSSVGHRVSTQTTVEVMPVVAQPAPVDNTFQVYCAGGLCGSQDTTTYRGDGVGVWRYHNATNTDATIDVAIGGLSTGQSAFLIFSNGNDVAAASVPQSGTATAPAGKSAMKARSPEVMAHEQIQALNRATLESLATRPRPSPQKAGPIARIVRAAAPSIGTTRVWRDVFGAPVAYNVEVAATCTFSTGRNGVVWMDTDQVERGELDPVRVQLVADFLCGENGAYERLVALHGDVYGDAVDADSGFIQDVPGNLQDLNVVILGVPQITAWGGYFSSANLARTDVNPDSNSALSVVLNGWYLGITTEEDSTTRNTLAHELKHLINFYQRGMRRGVYHAAWLEESSAMLAEELIGAELSAHSRTEARIGGYTGSGGGVGYIDWTHPEGGSYNLGGSFGSFLHRRYGTALDTYLVDTCIDNGSPTASYQCVDAFIVSQGGEGFSDEFARVGASVLGRMSGATPQGFGFRGTLAGDYRLAPVSCAALEPAVTAPRPLEGVYRATTHSYDYDFMDVGQTSFVRDGVVVPAGTTLLVVVNEAAR